MQHSDLTKLEERVREVARKSALGRHLGNVRLEAEADDEGSGLLRVLVGVRALDEVNDVDLERLLASIESALSALDDRFPSVRFEEAA